MRTWDDFKMTMRADEDLHAYARAGDVHALRTVVSTESVNRKDPKGYSPLMLAAYHGHVDAVDLLLRTGADAKGRDGSGNTILMGAAFKGHLEVVRLLIQGGADMHARNPRGQTALHFAQMFGRSEVANYLKSQQQKPEGFSWRDFFAGWSSFLLPQRSSK